MSGITTHVLDTSRGRPAERVSVTLEFALVDGWRNVARGSTDADGRVGDLVSDTTQIEPGVYRLTFDTADYFNAHNIKSFYPTVTVVFEVGDPTQHYHVPLLLSPFGYSTYRGS